MIAPLLVFTAAGGNGDDESDAGTFDDVTVTGKVGEAPEVKDAKGVEVDKMTSRVITEGDGPKVAEGDNATMKYVIIQAKDGKEMGGTFETEGTSATTLSSEQDTILAPALVGKPYGTRVLIGLTGKDLGQTEGEAADDTLLIVADVLEKWQAPKPTGTIADVSVSGKGDAEPKITLKKKPLVVAKTESKVVTPTKAKKAETVKVNDSVSVRYVGVNGRDGKTFDSSYKNGGGTVDFQLTEGQMIPGFITGLVGKKIGDRVLITIPYNDAYGAAGRPDGGINGGDTLVFVVDLVKKADPAAQPTP